MIGRRIVILGLSITSSWGNGHATTYRCLVKGLLGLGHQVTFLERDVPWYASHRDVVSAAWGSAHLYADVADLRERFAPEVAAADAVIVGSYVPQGPEVLRWVLDTAQGVVAFYDIDTPVTIAGLERGHEEYVSVELLPHLDLYLSFTGGPLLDHIRARFGVQRTAPLYCAVDPGIHFPEARAPQWDLGYLGTYSIDRQPKLEALLIDPARRLPDRRFVVAGPQYPPGIAWPGNVERTEHLPPDRHRYFYSGQRFTLNITRADMVRAGWSPSVRLFEAAACGVPIVSDDWPGLETFFQPAEEILIARGADDVEAILAHMPEEQRRAIAAAAHRRVLASHTSATRAWELEQHLFAPDPSLSAALPDTNAIAPGQHGGTRWDTAEPQAR